jgi:chromosome partitioning protein
MPRRRPTVSGITASPVDLGLARQLACYGAWGCVGSTNMQRILVLNPKGGSGKTTIATNLASYFASQGDRPLLSDMDPQGSSTRWLKKRKPDQSFIYGVAAFERNSRMTRAWQMRVPADAAHVVVDTPAAVPAQDMPDMTKNADAIIVPVLPSDIDIHACSKCIADLLLIAKVRRDEYRIGVVANRVKRNTVIYQSLMRFLETLRIPVIATLRDSQNYVRAAEQGVGVHEMKRYAVAQDLEDWQPMLAWLKAKEEAVRRPIEGINPLPETA